MPEIFDWNWRTVGEYLDRLDDGIAVNAAYLVPQGTVRMRHTGWDARPATADGIAHWMADTLGLGVEVRFLVLFALGAAGATAIATPTRPARS